MSGKRKRAMDALEKRAAFLAERIAASDNDLSFDRRELAAIRFAIVAIEENERLKAHSREGSPMTSGYDLDARSWKARAIRAEAEVERLKELQRKNQWVDLNTEDRLRKALEQIWNHPNAEHHHHSNECELRTIAPEDQDDEICTCGYWASSYPELKLIAREALRIPESETK